jgi:hypothetical protein
MKVKLEVNFENDLVISKEEFKILLDIKNCAKSMNEYIDKNKKDNTNMWDFMIESNKERLEENLEKYRKYEI